jgi:hypothetical protein
LSEIAEDAGKFASILIELSPILSKVGNEVVYDERGFGLKLNGFYKDGTVTVRPNPNYLIGGMGEALWTIDGRYEELAVIHRGDNLLAEVIKLNADRFRYWSEVKPEFKDIDPSWLPILLEHGLIEPVVTTTYKVR